MSTQASLSLSSPSPLRQWYSVLPGASPVSSFSGPTLLQPNGDAFQHQQHSQQPFPPFEPQVVTQNAFPAFVNPGMSPVAMQLPSHMAAPVPDLNADQAAQLLQAMMSQQPNGLQPPLNDLAGFQPALPNAPGATLLQDHSNGIQSNFVEGIPSAEASGSFFDKTWKKVTAALVAIAAIVIAVFALRRNMEDKEKKTPDDTSTKPPENKPKENP